jgi:hypothetical protein
VKLCPLFTVIARGGYLRRLHRVTPGVGGSDEKWTLWAECACVSTSSLISSAATAKRCKFIFRLAAMLPHQHPSSRKKQGILLLAKFLHRDDGGGWVGGWMGRRRRNERNGARSEKPLSLGVRSSVLRSCFPVSIREHRRPPPGDTNKLGKKLPAEFRLPWCDAF